MLRKLRYIAPAVVGLWFITQRSASAVSHTAPTRVVAATWTRPLPAPGPHARSARPIEPARPSDAPAEARDRVFRVCRVTAYCDRGLTAAGTLSGVGQCAAPEDIPFGTEVYVPALDRTFIVTDRTHKRFRQNTVDIFIPSEKDCLQFGLNYFEVEFRLPNDDWTRPRDPAAWCWARS